MQECFLLFLKKIGSQQLDKNSLDSWLTSLNFPEEYTGFLLVVPYSTWDRESIH